MWCALLVDTVEVLMALNPIFWLPEDEARSVASQGLVMSVINISSFMTRSYSMLNLSYDALALISVASGFSELKYWPNVFGRWRDAYTVRRFWGSVFRSACEDGADLDICTGGYGNNG